MPSRWHAYTKPILHDDDTGDLARVMRLAGTINFKTEPVHVTIELWKDERRYTPSDFDLPESHEPTIGVLPSVDISLNPKAEPPVSPTKARSSRLTALLDTPPDDRSAVRMSIISELVKASVSDQDIMDVLVDFYRRYPKRGDKLESILRPSQIGKEIAEQRAWIESGKTPVDTYEGERETLVEDGDTAPIMEPETKQPSSGAKREDEIPLWRQGYTADTLITMDIPKPKEVIPGPNLAKIPVTYMAG